MVKPQKGNRGTTRPHPADAVLRHRKQRRVRCTWLAGANAGRLLAVALKKSLLGSDAALQLAACRLLAALASSSPPRIAAELIGADVCEFALEVLRSTRQQTTHPNCRSSCEGMLNVHEVQAAALDALWALSAAGARSWWAAVQTAGEVEHEPAPGNLNTGAMQPRLCIFAHCIVAGQAFHERLRFGLETLTSLLTTSIQDGDAKTQCRLLDLLRGFIVPLDVIGNGIEQSLHVAQKDVVAKLAATLVQASPSACSSIARYCTPDGCATT